LQQNAVKPLKTGVYLQQKMAEYSKYSFSGINVKKAVAIKFRKFSRQISVSHTQALEAMLYFFERNDLAPDDDLGIHNNRTNKRINAVIAILKNIEKHQTKPTAEILQSLLYETANIEKEEDFDFGSPVLITENEELAFYKKQYKLIQEENMGFKNKMTKLLDQVNVEKRSFGKDYLKLNLDKIDFDNFRKSNNV
tara:strand:- start:1287 stop:1871 length:585 start_codon:yes stop_codon:yes gene_type:complete